MSDSDKILTKKLSDMTNKGSINYLEALKIGHSLGIGDPLELTKKLEREQRLNNENYNKKIKKVRKDFENGNLKKEDEYFFKNNIEDILSVDFN